MGEVKLEDVCEFFRGLTYSKKNETTFSDKIVLRASNIDLDTSTLVLHDLKYLKENFVIPDDKKLQKDCIFICMSSGSKSHLGKVAYIARDYDYAFGGFMGLIKPKTNILPRYLFYLLQTPEYKELIKKLSNGININNIKFSDLKEFQFELPSLEEQEKILNILDKADEIRTKKKQANEKLDEFLKSTFVDMFGDPVNNTKNYPVQNIASFAKVKIGPFGSSLHKEEYITDGIPLVNPSQIVDEKIVFDSSVSITEKKYKELQAYWLQKDDIIIGRRGEIGRAAVVSNNVRCICGTGSLFIRINKPVIQPLILQKIISSNTMKEKLLNNSVGVTMNNLNAGIIENLGIAIPPIEHQNKFAQIVKKVEEQKQRNKKVIEQMDNLFNSLSQKAFKGDF